MAETRLHNTWIETDHLIRWINETKGAPPSSARNRTGDSTRGEAVDCPASDPIRSDNAPGSPVDAQPNIPELYYG